MSGASPGDGQTLEALSTQLRDAGFEGLVDAPALATALQDPSLSDDERLEKVVAAWRELALRSIAVLDGELEKMRRLEARLQRDDLYRAKVAQMQKAFALQRGGLHLLVRFLDEGDRAVLQQARHRIGAGTRAAQAAAAAGR